MDYKNENNDNIDREHKADIELETSDTHSTIARHKKKLINKIGKSAFEWLTVIVTSFLLVFLLRTFIMTTSVVVGDSMYPTLHNKDYLIVRKIAYAPQRGDVIIFKKTDDVKTLVKRVIAIAGDKLSIDSKTHKIVLNDKVLDEAYIAGAPTYEYPKNSGNVVPTEFPIQKVPENKVLAFGDNRTNSLDSRAKEIGLIDRSEIIGKVEIRLWPADRIRKI